MTNKNANPRLVLGAKCGNGHVITEHNLYTYFDGRTACRDCYMGQRAAARGRPRMYDNSESSPKKQVKLAKLKFMGEVSDD